MLCKTRPALAPLLVSSMTSWTPAALLAVGRHPMEVRAVEKTMRMVMTHVLRHPPFAAFAAQLNDALVRQKQRMEAAFVAEQQARKDRKKGLKQTLKHPMEAESSEQAAKRARLEVQPGVGLGRGPEVDVTTFPVEAVIDAVMTGLEVVPLELLTRAFDNARRALAERTGDAIPLLATALGVVKEEVKEEDDDEILNPLDMDLDDEDLLQPDDVQEEEVIAFTDFVLPPPEPLDPSEKDYVLDSAIQRIWTIGSDLASLPDPKESDAVKTAVQPKEMWMLLLARLATRGADVKRKAVCDFVAADFINRSKFASVWLNEEWYNEKIGMSNSGQYIANLDAILTAYLPKIDAKDKSLAAFILTLPEIPTSVIALLESICQDTERNVVGFLALRDIIESRPPVRQVALQTLLELCTHPDRKVRVMAIITVIRRWGHDSPMMPSLIKFALGVLWRLADSNKAVGEEDGKTNDVDMEEGEQTEEKVVSKFLGEISPETVQQHVELAFALSKRQQDMLDDIFRLYPKLDQPIQEAVEAQLMPLIQSLGASEKLLEILKTFPAGAEKLVMKVVALLSADGASPVLVSLIKGLLSERELDPRFVVPIVGDLDKAEIEKQLPRIVSLLGDPDSKDMVRTAFASMLQKMTPADLLVALHQEEAEEVKLTIEAIGICFSMTTVFRSDVLANAIARIADLPTLPVVLMRTIIQVVTTYKSLIPFVANHILPKLVAKKIWETPRLWEGFVRLARITAPASYGALLQLPKEQLKDLVTKQVAMKAGLKSFLASKPGSKAALAEIFGDEA
ncbi:hypothetical protein CI109_105758 [Kwoniella shandongensis]|uniref:Symplekin C-terminal domain-containing protein n=1 Tax=Kwoniella shandongensis TaxID=1734106 RepID=A0AAJ8LNX8_9TREE